MRGLKSTPRVILEKMRYKDKVVIITGGSSGIGKGCAQEFVKAGSKVVICSNRQSEGEQAVSELKTLADDQSIGEVSFIYCDVKKTEDIGNLINEVVRRHGQIDCLINNAGWHPPHKTIDDFTEEEFRDLLNLNLISVFTACKLSLPYLRISKGNIINISSLVAVIGQHHATTYVATKGAVTAFTKALAIDEAAHGVRVNAVSPSNIYTPLWQEAIDTSPDPKQAFAEGEAMQLMGRFGTAEEVGRLCVFIAAESSFTTGVDHIISGGSELAYGRKSQI